MPHECNNAIATSMQGGQALPLFITTQLKHFNSYSAQISIPYCKGDKVMVNASQCDTYNFHIGATMSAKHAGIFNIHIQI